MTLPNRPLDARRWEQPRDAGFALLSVVAGMAVVLGLLTVVLTHSTSTLRDVRYKERWNLALVAAEAGISDYLARLNRDDNYWNKVDCANTALRGPRNAATCGYNAPGWAPVPGSNRGQFHYDVDTASTYTTGQVVLTVTGRVEGVTRTVEARLRRDGFGEFLYYTDFETVDPANEAVYGYNNTAAAELCARYFYGSESTRRDPRCSDINFVTGDVIDGPLHTNDAILVQGKPVFNGTTTTSYPECMATGGKQPPPTKCYRAGAEPAPVFNRGIAYRKPVPLPESPNELLRFVDPSFTSKPGCLYTGPTRIKFNDNPTGQASTMTVWSRFSTGTLNPGCGDTTKAWPQTLPLPDNNLIFVRDVPATQSSPASGACANGTIGDGYPQAGDLTRQLRESDCRYGTAYIEGVLKGRVTIATDNNVLLTRSVTYSGGTRGTDALGLIAANSVKVYHPVRCSAVNNNGQCVAVANMEVPGGGFNGPITVHAAILAVNHSFTVSLYQYGEPLDKLNLFGTIAQKYRGPVGTGGTSGVATGYLKNYVYDTRMRYAPPPFFLDPVQAAWGVKAFGELQARYR